MIMITITPVIRILTNTATADMVTRATVTPR